MLRHREFVTAYLNGVPRFDTPILSLWLHAFSLSLFGSTETALRLPSALAAVLWVVVLWRFARSKVAVTRPPCWLLPVNGLPVLLIARTAGPAPLTALLLTLSLLSIWHYYQQADLKTLSRIALWSGLAVMAGGMIGLLLPLLASLLLFAGNGLAATGCVVCCIRSVSALCWRWHCLAIDAIPDAWRGVCGAELPESLGRSN
ncbi:MAG: glycosyltransferase family 39 protein [Thiolinea sp.]